MKLATPMAEAASAISEASQQVTTDQIKAVYVENDLSKIAEYTTAIQNMSSHQETLTNLCNVDK